MESEKSVILINNKDKSEDQLFKQSYKYTQICDQIKKAIQQGNKQHKYQVSSRKNTELESKIDLTQKCIYLNKCRKY